MRTGLLLIALVLAVPAAAQSPDLARGKRLYAARCISCHGPDGRGVTSVASARGRGGTKALGPPLAGTGALAADFYLTTGRMPLDDPYSQPERSKPSFSKAEIDSVVQYVASLGAGPAVPSPHPERGSLSEGFRLFAEKCAGCHQIVGRGGVVTGGRVPPIGGVPAVQIAEAVRIGPHLMPRFSERDLSPAELDSIILYVQYARDPRDDGGWPIGRLGAIPEGIVAWLLAGAVLLVVCLVIGRRATR